MEINFLETRMSVEWTEAAILMHRTKSTKNICKKWWKNKETIQFYESFDWSMLFYRRFMSQWRKIRLSCGNKNWFLFMFLSRSLFRFNSQPNPHPLMNPSTCETFLGIIKNVHTMWWKSLKLCLNNVKTSQPGARRRKKCRTVELSWGWKHSLTLTGRL